MSKSNKEKNSIVTMFVLFLLLTLGLIYFVLFKIIPGIIEVENLKNATLETYDNIKQKEKSGLTFEEFQSIRDNIVNTEEEKDLYFTEVLKSIDKEFYDKNLVNTGTGTYNDFILELNKKYSDSSSFDENINIISNVLPVYTEGISDVEGNYLSDYKFINYIESIAETFNISFSDPIGISQLELVTDYAITVGDNSLEKNIFYIPLSLNISGTKDDIINFLYFIQNVGNISVDGNKLNVELDIDKNFQEFKTKALKGQIKTGNYNIFNNQIFDVESVTFEKYIDSSFDVLEANQDFISYIKSFQGNDMYGARIDLRFYVKGIPLFKIESYVKDFILSFDRLNNDIAVNLGDENLSDVARNKLNEYKSHLDELNTGLVADLKKSISTKVDVEKSFMDANRYKGLINEYSEYLESLKK
ncbi:MAG: hypothetical protein PHI37_00485 [Candidatus Gracilibacteria bacterium]|nr:hypothetical protein [Candidatus Gracilibacteria bacterium]